MRSSIRTIVVIWLAWILILIGFQALAAARYQPARPDRALFWTATETTATAQNDKPYLLDPFMNYQVSWDSEFYLAIATGGYDDPQVRSIPVGNTRLSLSYAFMPLYPYAIRLAAFPLRVLGLTPIATSTLAGVIVSALGTLAGMLALYDLARDEAGATSRPPLAEAGGIRAAFYLVIFPTGFFLGQVYTEGLFVGLSFGCLALIRRRQMVGAAVLGALAAWTRAAGVALVIPLALPWLRDGDWMQLDLEWKQLYFQGVPWKAIGKAVMSLAPLLAFLVWRFSAWGQAFNTVEELFFGRGLLSLGSSFMNWSAAWRSLFGANPQATAYYLIEFGAIALGLAACFAMWRRYPDLSAYSLAVLFLSLFSGPAQSMHRYILTAPAVFLFLSRLGKSEAFDRAWCIASILLMGLLATVFTFDFFAG